MRRCSLPTFALAAALATSSSPASAGEVDDEVASVSEKVAEIDAFLKGLEGLPRDVAGAPQALLDRWKAHVESLGPGRRVVADARARRIFALSPRGSAEIRVVAASDGATPSISIQLKGPGSEPVEEALLMASGAPVLSRGRVVLGRWQDTLRRFRPMGKGRWLTTVERSDGYRSGAPPRTRQYVTRGDRAAKARRAAAAHARGRGPRGRR